MGLSISVKGSHEDDHEDDHEGYLDAEKELETEQSDATSQGSPQEGGGQDPRAREFKPDSKVAT